MYRSVGESPVKKKAKESMEDDDNEMQLELDVTKELLASALEREKMLEKDLEREKRERMELEKKEETKDRDFREFLLLSNSEMHQIACKLSHTSDPFNALAQEMAAIRMEKFPFHSLPDELISHTFSFLSMEDRLRSRVNKRLNRIELQSKYHVNRLRIWEENETNTWPTEEDVQSMRENKSEPFIYLKRRFYSTECVRRLAHDVSIGTLSIRLTGSTDFHRDVYSLIKDFDVDKLELRFGNDEMEKEFMVDSNFIDLTKACKELDLWKCENVSAEAIHQVYKAMMERSGKLRELDVFATDTQCIPFLALVGITYRDGIFFSRRKIEAIESDQDADDYDEDFHWTHVFDENFQISLDHDIFKFESGVFTLKLHDSRESLNEAKNRKGYVNVDITPE